MAYTDKTVYLLRECLDEYSEMAIMFRDEEATNSELRKLAAKASINIKPRTDAIEADKKLAKEREQLENIQFSSTFLKKMIKSMKAFVDTKLRLKKLLSENRELRKKLRKAGVSNRLLDETP